MQSLASDSMNDSLLALLLDPILKTPLRLEATVRGQNDDIIEGILHAADGRSFEVTEGIPRFAGVEDDDQAQTAASFGYKWGQVDTYDSPDARERAKNWLVQRYGFEELREMRAFFSARRRILDAGCGSGFSASLWMDEDWQGQEWVGVDLSRAIDVARRRLSNIPNTHFVQADLMQLPFADGTFDTIFSEGVLHHTPSTAGALIELARLLEPGGEFMFYVYRKKSPVREFTDDHIRRAISQLPPAQAWEELRPLTKLGQALADLGIEVDIPETVGVLGIPAGRYELHRLVYWHFAKLFWNESMSFEENHHVNFDWYHPRYAHRQTEAEVRRWCQDAGLRIVAFHTEESGFTVRAVMT